MASRVTGSPPRQTAGGTKCPTRPKALKPVNVRETPSTSAKVVKVIEAGELMEASSRSAETSTIGSDTDYWYFITSPVRGWVFGAFVEGVK